MSRRIPIIPAFEAVGVLLGGDTYDLAVSDVFDLGHISSKLNDMPIVEAHELKAFWSMEDRLKSVRYDGENVQYNPDGIPLLRGEMIAADEAVVDRIGCWSLYEAKGERPQLTPNLGQYRT